MKVFKAIWGWIDDRTGISEFVMPIVLHPVPQGTDWWYVFGTAILTSFIVQVVTGIALSSAYVTSTSDAYDSLQFITNNAFLGNFLRAMHFWGAGAMVLFIGIHMAQVFLFGAVQVSQGNELAYRLYPAAGNAGYGFHGAVAALGPERRMVGRSSCLASGASPLHWQATGAVRARG